MNRFKQWGAVGFVVLVISIGTNLAAAATFVWTGASSGNWSDSGNWTNGTPPTSSGSDDIRLMPASNPPANQDIAGLSIGTLIFDANPAGYTVGGNTITLKKINS